MIEEALDHAERIVAERGAGAVTIAEIARQLGIRPPSVYKYFPSLFWRPIPGFEPSPASYSLVQRLVERSRADLAAAVRGGELAPRADTDEAFRLSTSISAGLCSQQLANEPDATYESGLFTSLTDQALDMFVQLDRWRPGRRSVCASERRTMPAVAQTGTTRLSSLSPNLAGSSRSRAPRRARARSHGGMCSPQKEWHPCCRVL